MSLCVVTGEQCSCEPMEGRPCPEVAALRARVAELEAALKAIQQYGSDTLSGPVAEPDDRKWHRDGVVEMTRRASVALETQP